ncbi:hypothetical protein QAD02_022222 [Eretmocerus hayati]|uniref:Uncharacterized protein n=1 Tax=Eretmocerus hayati TaxID=131215 RepID=A0ACC2PTY4_9HYME|nr:hypothetical protein QAD02_022222 [Eretmocerus hayati]
MEQRHEKIEYFLDENEDVNEKDENELRPLDIAIMTNNLAAVQLLVSYKNYHNTVDYISLYYLACSQNNEMIPHLFNGECSTRVRGSKGENLLHLAIIEGYEKFADTILNYCHNFGMDIDEQTKNGFTPLHLTILHNQPNIFCHLLHESRVDFRKKSVEGSSSIHFAVEQNNEFFLMMLIERRVDVNDIVTSTGDDRGWNVLHVAAHNDHTKLVKFFLEKGIDINSLTNDGSSSLLLAIINNKKDSIQMLLENGADVSVRNKNSLNSLCAAIKNENRELTKQLHSLGANIQHLVEEDIVQELLKQKMDIDEMTVDKSTALHFALHSNIITELLINYGIKIDAENEHGDTALCVQAKTKCCHDALRCLLRNGANLNHVPKDEVMPLQTSFSSCASKAELLAKHGANLQKVNGIRDSCLHAAVKYWIKTDDSYDLLPPIDKFLELGADINWVNEDGFGVNSTTPNGSTILQYAAQYGDRRTIKLLLKAGLEVDDANYEGKTPLHTAVSQGSVEAVKILVERDADISKTDRDWNTALHLAVLRGDIEIVKLLIKKGAVTCKKMQRVLQFMIYQIKMKTNTSTNASYFTETKLLV